MSSDDMVPHKFQISFFANNSLIDLKQQKYYAAKMRKTHFANAVILILLIFDNPSVSYSFMLRAPIGLISPYRLTALTPRRNCRNVCGIHSLHMSESNEVTDPNNSHSAAMDGFQNSSYMEVDPAKRKAKALALRTEALQLDADAAKLRDEALNLERKAAKLRIESWKTDGSISAVTNTVTIEDKYERQLAELDLMSEDYMDDPEKFEWYRAQRLMLIEMMGFQKEQEAKANEEIKELKESLLDVQVIFCNTSDILDNLSYRKDSAGSLQCSICR